MKKELIKYYRKREPFDILGKRIMIITLIVVAIFSVIDYFLKLDLLLAIIIVVIIILFLFIVTFFVWTNKKYKDLKIGIRNFNVKIKELRNFIFEESKEIIQNFFYEYNINNIQMKKEIYNELEYKKSFDVFSIENATACIPILYTLIRNILSGKIVEVDIKAISYFLICLFYFCIIMFIYKLIFQKSTTEEEIKLVYADVLNDIYNNTKETD